AHRSLAALNPNTKAGGPSPMSEVTMPQLGETVTEGTITRWFKQVGEQVAVDEVLYEVSTDKVDSEVPSPASGYLAEIRVPEGETVDVGTVLAVLTDSPVGNGDGSAPPAAAPAAAPAEPAPEAPAAPAEPAPEAAQAPPPPPEPAPPSPAPAPGAPAQAAPPSPPTEARPSA